ncbi:MAG: hypothetical protein MJH10_11270 [Epibacterium sp.]|nr:hypothetical protein [Epibacterium sp.]NQX74127.1 hypothetical protein [Epibacterium sp.]
MRCAPLALTLGLVVLSGCLDPESQTGNKWEYTGTESTRLEGYVNDERLAQVALMYAEWIEDRQSVPARDPIGLERQLDNLGVDRQFEFGYIGRGDPYQLAFRHNLEADKVGAATVGDYSVVIGVLMPIRPEGIN